MRQQYKPKGGLFGKLRTRMTAEWAFYNANEIEQGRNTLPQYFPFTDWFCTELRTVNVGGVPTQMHIFKFSDLVNELLTQDVSLIGLTMHFPWGVVPTIPTINVLATGIVDAEKAGPGESDYGIDITSTYNISFDPTSTAVQAFTLKEAQGVPNDNGIGKDMDMQRYDWRTVDFVLDRKVYFTAGLYYASQEVPPVPYSDTSSFAYLEVNVLA